MPDHKQRVDNRLRVAFRDPTRAVEVHGPKNYNDGQFLVFDEGVS